MGDPERLGKRPGGPEDRPAGPDERSLRPARLGQCEAICWIVDGKKASPTDLLITNEERSIYRLAPKPAPAAKP